MAAASAAVECGKRVTLVDDNPAPGGQIWRGERRMPAAGVELAMGSAVIAAEELEGRPVILATGARERFLPFPGWTLPNVMGAGGLQSFVKGGLCVEGKRVVVAGTGPLLLAVAAYLKGKGAEIAVIAEQAPLHRLAYFALALTPYPAKLWQAIELRLELGGTRYATSTWVIEAEGEDRLRAVRLRSGEVIECDYLAVGYGLVPNLELPKLLGCEISNAVVRVDRLQRTSIDGVYAAGELTGIGGVEKAEIEGRIAGLAAAGRSEEAFALSTRREGAVLFAEAMAEAFALRDDLRLLPDEDTVICRCENIRFNEVRGASCRREAKLQTRCGMGACQGRVCGAAGEFLFGWTADSIRPPLFAAPVDRLLTAPDTSSRSAR
jgi:NADPH-dependent 2,4-dienoyl-CoA reductase/sulfur reductase-like enzyme